MDDLEYKHKLNITVGTEGINEPQSRYAVRLTEYSRVDPLRLELRCPQPTLQVIA
jgi:hypothetical protein